MELVGAQPPPIPYILGEEVNYLTLRVQFYANECNKRLEALTPNPNECNSTLTSGTRGIYPHRYILMLMSRVIGYELSVCVAGYELSTCLAAAR